MGEAPEGHAFAMGAHRQVELSRILFQVDLIVQGVLHGLADHGGLRVKMIYLDNTLLIPLRCRFFMPPGRRGCTGSPRAAREVVALDHQLHGVPKGRQFFHLQLGPPGEAHPQQSLPDSALSQDLQYGGRVPGRPPRGFEVFAMLDDSLVVYKKMVPGTQRDSMSVFSTLALAFAATTVAVTAAASRIGPLLSQIYAVQ